MPGGIGRVWGSRARVILTLSEVTYKVELLNPLDLSVSTTTTMLCVRPKLDSENGGIFHFVSQALRYCYCFGFGSCFIEKNGFGSCFIEI
jgi:hypothetical protein